MPGISKHHSTTAALDDVSLELEAGEIHCLLGENGAGKSTLVKIIAGLERQDDGRLLINGKEVGTSRRFRSQKLGMTNTFENRAAIR